MESPLPSSGSPVRRVATWPLVGLIAPASAAVCLVGGLPAHAQLLEATANSDEAAADEEILFEADTLTRQFDDGPIVAEGNVRAYFGGRYLSADRLVFDPKTEIVTAEGNVAVTDRSNETAFAKRVVLSGDLRDGIIESFSAILGDNARIAGATAIQEQGARTRITKGVYTACDVCTDEGDPKTPTWRFRALRVTRDLERKVVRFHHAFLEIKGIPILYTPFFQGPDPSVERQSGFLAPGIGASGRLGLNVELPYYFAISNSQDATFFPKFTAQEGTLWQGEYRRRGKRSYHVLSGGVTDYDNTDEAGVPGVRWHIFGSGRRDFGDHWRYSYDIERVSDDVYLRFYDVNRRGDLIQVLDRANTNQLRSNSRFTRTSDTSRLTIDTYLFQGLRSTDDRFTTPFVLPLIDYNKEFKIGSAGDRVQVNANVASLYRTGGVDSQRFSAAAQWGRDITTRNGHRFQLFGEVRGDLYAFQDLDEGTEIIDGLDGDDTRFEGRVAPTIGARWSYPLARDFGSARLFLEPQVQVAVSPSNRNSSAIINEDSQSIEFDYAGLFDFNKATGYDSIEDGQRVNVGVAASASWPDGFSVSGSLGQQFRVQETAAFDFESGLGTTTSDVVGAVDFKFGSVASLENRFRVDEKFKTFGRLESLARVRLGPARGTASYIRLNEENAANNLVRREELTANTRLNITDNVTLGAGWRFDLEDNITIQQDFLLGYEDECLSIALTFRRDRTRDTNLDPQNAFLLRFRLKSIAG